MVCVSWTLCQLQSYFLTLTYCEYCTSLTPVYILQTVVEQTDVFIYEGTLGTFKVKWLHIPTAHSILS